MTSKLQDTTGTKKLNQTKNTKTINITHTRKGGSTHKEENQLEEVAKELFKGKIPTDLRVKGVDPKEGGGDKTKKLDQQGDSKSGAGETGNKTGGEDKAQPPVATQKDDTYVVGQTDIVSSSINELSDEEYRKNELIQQQAKKASTEKDLEKKIYITLSETATNFMYFLPSQRYFHQRLDADEKEEEKRKEEAWKSYLNKLKNKEAFINRGIQTLNPFKRNQVVTTSDLNDQEIDQTANQKVNALNWAIHDSINETRNKKDDEAKIFQKKLEKKIKRELNMKLKASEYMVNPDESYNVHRSQTQSDTYSMIDTKFSNSIPSSKRTKISKRPGESVDKSVDQSSVKQSGNSPNSSAVKTGTEQMENRPEKQPLSKVHKALDEVLPNSLVYPLKFVERLLSQNKFHTSQIAYKNYPIIESDQKQKQVKRNNLVDPLSLIADQKDENEENEEDEKEVEDLAVKGDKPDMKFLFRFEGKSILEGKKYIVHCLDWNPYNKDLLAAAYGDPDIDSTAPGLLLFWTLKNPLHPERVIQTPRGITSCHFSNKNPYYIVCADYAGEILIYDLRSQSNKPIADSTELKDKHTDIVWEVRWVERPNDKNEIIVSISSDGKVKEWSLKKGLEVSDLMKMKKNISFPDKSLSPFSKYDKFIKESLIFRDANGLSFDFPKNDTTVYYISLEECTVHRCRISYKDQYTENYYGHQGPVYKVRCNPYDPNILITCSYDWSMKIWNSKQKYAKMTCHSMYLTHQINDVEWSPFTSTIFGCVADDGRIEIWDLARQSIDPIIELKQPEGSTISRKSIKFSRSSQVVAVGDNDFGVDVFRLFNLEHVQVSEDDQRLRLKIILDQNSS